ncbi:MAG: 30S ribosomal protein S10, partial [Candidatus Izemoplasmatales bacterium]
MQKARIKLSSTDYKMLEEICDRIIDVAERTGAKHSGKIPLPTKKLIIPTRKGPSGGGTESYEHWQMRVHK